MSGRLLALVRHPAPAVAAGVCYGRLDVGLAAGAPARIAAIVRQLGRLRIRHVWTSPAARCVRVAEAIGAAAGVAVRPDPRLLELDFGAWEGLRWDDVPRDALDRWAASPSEFSPPGGESGRTLTERVGAFRDRMLRETGDTVIVSHGGPLKLLAALLRGRAADLLAAAPPLASVDIFSAQGSPRVP